MNKGTGGKDDLVPAHLSYSYRFGAEHLRDVPKEDHDQDLLQHQLKDFLHVHLVRWFDVMTFTKDTPKALTALSVASQWITVCSRASFPFKKNNIPTSRTA
jgi:hypothetical protein